MRRQRTTLGLSLVAVLLLTSGVSAQITVQTFEGPLPGPSAYPGGYDYWGSGILVDPGPPEVYLEPNRGLQITDQDAAGGLQSFEISIDATNIVNSYFYGGLGGDHGSYGEGFGFAEGQPGQNNPANYRMTFDLKVLGNDGDTEALTPIGGAVGMYKGDYEAVYDIDVNNDGDKNDGFDIWNSTFIAAVNDNEWNKITWVLNSGTTPTTNGSPVPTPVFDDRSFIYFQIYFNSGGFGLDNNNIIRIDNVALEYVEAASLPGDFDFDGDVDGRDFLIWQRGDSPTGPLSPLDLTAWQEGYLNGGLTAGFSAVPEPSSWILAAVMAMGAFGRRRRP